MKLHRPQPRWGSQIPLPAAAIGILCALEGLFLYLLPSFGAFGPEAPPLAFEAFWFRRQGVLSLQQTLMGGNVLLALVLWASYRTGRGASGGAARTAAYVGAGVLLAAAQWACRAVSMAAPKLVLVRIFP